jgi:transposase
VCFLFDGPINGESFLQYVEQFLVPTLKPGDLVVMDNLGSHKGEAVKLAIRAAGARLVFLPAYSPDLNPIEHAFAKLKHFLRKAKERSVEARWGASERSSPPSHHRSAQTTSPMPPIGPCRDIPL